MPLAFAPEDWARLLVAPYDALRPHEKVGALEFAKTLGTSESPRDTAALFHDWSALPGAGAAGYVEDVLTYIQSRLAPALITDEALAAWRTALSDGRAAKDPRVKVYVAARDKANTERALIIEREISTLSAFLGAKPADLRMSAISERNGVIIWVWLPENREFFLATEKEHAMLAMSGLANNLTLLLEAPRALVRIAGMTEEQVATLREVASTSLEECHTQLADYLEAAAVRRTPRIAGLGGRDHGRAGRRERGGAVSGLHRDRDPGTRHRHRPPWARPA
jgi:hypothetical protein